MGAHQGHVYTGGVEELQRTCRILAVLICPAPEDHTAVQNGALLPPAKEGMLEISKERLEQVFPSEWGRPLWQAQVRHQGEIAF